MLSETDTMPQGQLVSAGQNSPFTSFSGRVYTCNNENNILWSLLLQGAPFKSSAGAADKQCSPNPACTVLPQALAGSHGAGGAFPVPRTAAPAFAAACI